MRTCGRDIATGNSPLLTGGTPPRGVYPAGAECQRTEVMISMALSERLLSLSRPVISVVVLALYI